LIPAEVDAEFAQLFAREFSGLFEDPFGVRANLTAEPATQRGPEGSGSNAADSRSSKPDSALAPMRIAVDWHIRPILHGRSRACLTPETTSRLLIIRLLQQAPMGGILSTLFDTFRGAQKA
jgi:hypothetical protein